MNELGCYDKKWHRALEKIMDSIDLIPENGWVENNRDEQQGFLNHIREDEESGMTVCRGEGIIDIPIDKMQELLANPMNKCKYSKRCDHIEMLENTPEGHSICYNTVRSPFGSDRDVLSINGSFKKGDTTFIVCTSIEDQKLKEEQRGKVRADIKYQSHILMPQANGKTKIILVNCMDIKGMIPKFIRKQMMKNIGIQGIQNIQTCLNEQIRAH